MITMVTKYGNAHINQLGYVVIHNGKYNRKYLHRLIYEESHRVTLLPSAIIHHKDGNRLNNSIDNLEMVSKEKHNKIHHKCKINSDETIDKMRKSKMGRNNPNFGNGKSGYYRVYKVNRSQCKQGFTWVYQYHDGDKRKSISRVDLKELETEVKNRGLEWFKIEVK